MMDLQPLKNLPMNKAIETIEWEMLKVFTLEMKRCYALANKESQWSEMTNTDEKKEAMRIKMNTMLSELKMIPMRAYPAVFKKAREIMSEMDYVKNIPDVVILIKAWNRIKNYWGKTELEQMQDLSKPQLPDHTFDKEAHEECFNELRKMGLFK